MTDRRLLFGVIAGTFLVYLAALLVVARASGASVSVVPVWDAGASNPDWLVAPALLLALSGTAISLLLPAVPWVLAMAGGPLRAGALFSRAFGLNLLLAVAFVSVWKFVNHTSPPRLVFVAWQALVTASGFALLSRDAGWPLRARRQPDLRSLLAGGMTLLVLVPLLLWQMAFIDDASGDGTEAFEFARSLATHQLPYWDLENGFYGFYPNFMAFAYPTHLSFLTLGEVAGAQRFPVFLYVFGVFLALREVILRRARALAGTELLLLLGAVVLFIVLQAYYATYEVVSDLGEPFGVDVFFGFLAAAAFLALLSRQRFWWGLFSFLMAIALSSGFRLSRSSLLADSLQTRVDSRHLGRMCVTDWRSPFLGGPTRSSSTSTHSGTRLGSRSGRSQT